jgi:ABC-2 type transport system permease protein
VKRVGSLVVALFKDWGRNREAVFFAVLFPILLLVIFSTVFASGPVEFTVFVQNNDVVDGEPTNLSATFVDSLEGTDPITVQHIESGRNITDWSQANRTTGSKRVVVVPEGFARQVRNATVQARLNVIVDTVARARQGANDTQQAAFQDRLADTRDRVAANTSGSAEILFLSSSDDQTAPAIRGILTSVISRFNDEALGVDTPPTNLTTADLGAENLSSADYYLPAFIAALVLINGVMGLTVTVAGFNADGTLKRLAATPLRKRDWILATVIQQSILAVVLTGVMVVVAQVFFGVTATPGLPALALVLLAAIGFGALGMTLGSFVSDPDAASSLANAIAFPLMFLSGVFWEVELMPEFLQTLATLLPVYHFHRGLRRLMIVGTTDGVAVAFAFLGAMAAVFLALAVYTTGWRDFE